MRSTADRCVPTTDQLASVAHEHAPAIRGRDRARVEQHATRPRPELRVALGDVLGCGLSRRLGLSVCAPTMRKLVRCAARGARTDQLVSVVVTTYGPARAASSRRSRRASESRRPRGGGGLGDGVERRGRRVSRRAVVSGVGVHARSLLRHDGRARARPRSAIHHRVARVGSAGASGRRLVAVALELPSVRDHRWRDQALGASGGRTRATVLGRSARFERADLAHDGRDDRRNS